MRNLTFLFFGYRAFVESWLIVYSIARGESLPKSILASMESVMVVIFCGAGILCELLNRKSSRRAATVLLILLLGYTIYDLQLIESGLLNRILNLQAKRFYEYLIPVTIGLHALVAIFRIKNW